VQPTSRRMRRVLAGGAGGVGLVTAAVLLLWCGHGTANEPATTETLPRRLKSAKGGEVIRLAASHYGRLEFKERSYDPPIRIDASQAEFSAIEFQNVTGVEITGGKVHAPDGEGTGVHVKRSAHIRIEGMRISGAHRGIVVGASSDVVIAKNH